MELAERLNQATHWDAEYSGHLSNHLPMALAALHRLGASAQRLDEYTARYLAQHSPHLHPAPAPQTWAPGDPWRERFGDGHAWPLYRDFFRQWLAHEGAAEVLQQALPHLMAGCGAAAFHGLIRTAHAFESVAALELADALAYWACRWMDLSPAPHRAVQPTETDPAALLPALMAQPTSHAGVIVLRMLDAARGRSFPGVVARLAVQARTLPRLARGAAQLYARSGNFTVLHLVTSAHAVRVLLPFVEDSDLAVAHYWRAYAAAVVAARLQTGRAAPLQDWAALTQAALASDDDHLVKLVDACRQEQAAHGGAPDWQRAASRAVLDASQRGGATRATAPTRKPAG